MICVLGRPQPDPKQGKSLLLSLPFAEIRESEVQEGQCRTSVTSRGSAPAEHGRTGESCPPPEHLF